MRERFFEIAKAASFQSNHIEHQVGAVLVNKNRVISVGFNKMKTSPKSNSFHKRIHAELSAILKSRENLKGSTVYVYRAKKNGQLGLSKPCDSCREALIEAGVKWVWYTSENGYCQERLV